MMENNGKQAVGLGLNHSLQDTFKKFRKEKYLLSLILHNAEGIEPVSKYPANASRRNYRACVWIDPESRYETDEVVGGIRKVAFDEEIRIQFNNDYGIPLETNFLSLEIVRVRSRCDPGPSRGSVVVGRLRVPLPKVPLVKISRRFGLVRLVNGEIVGEGHIGISMKVIPFH
ncbi:hypothetical protein CCACVL1_08527 [Corchorus capsularis]|uniref:C2 calcium-dependent membrane targeting n=2 Tax=cellular organisms TaxID=131567 RepID=A0A1R3J093_COCAP|nr:hypothetical protein CCACVL1_08527 [Corchorus capsularis]